jgi:hypothetical protein
MNFPFVYSPTSLPLQYQDNLLMFKALRKNESEICQRNTFRSQTKHLTDNMVSYVATSTAQYFYCFSDQQNTINDFISIYLSPSLLHVSAGNYGHHQVVLQQYKRMK